MCNKILCALLRFCGKNYTPDAGVPASYIIRLIIRRAIWAIRGIFKTGRICFVGPRTSVENACNIQLGRFVTIENDVMLSAVLEHKMVLGNHVKIGAFSRIMGTAHLSSVGKYFNMGEDSSCGEYCFFGAAGGITIGSRVIMGQYVSFHAQEHNFDDPSRPIKDQGVTEKGIEIADDCWIGAKATLLDGTKIGTHSVIAAGAVVKGEFPPYSLIAGVPAKIIRNLKEAA